MKIGITCYPSVGGSGIVATELGLQLAKRGHEIHFITSETPYRLNYAHHNIFTHGIDVTSYSVFKYPPYDITLANKIATVIDEFELDIIHMHYAVPHAICGILANQIAKRDVKIVTTLHGTDITILGQDLSLKSAIKFGIENSDVTTSVSNSLKQDTYDLIGPESDIQTIFNFIDEEKFNYLDDTVRQDMRKRYHIEEDTTVVIHASNFREIKRIDHIIRAFHLASQKTEMALVLVGDGPLTSKMKALTVELDIRHKVFFVGQQAHVGMYYLMSDIFMLMSEKESFGLSLLEAMNCGLVPIGTEAGGIPEVIKHDETGYIVPIGDYEKAGEYLVQLALQPELRETLKEAMLKDVATRFESTKIIDQYEDMYKKLLGENNA